AGQVNADDWKRQGELVYPASAKDMLIIQQWSIAGEPSREERYRRVNRFTSHCRKLGIPNPYSMEEIHRADQRWKKLHQNAVPALLEFKEQGVYIDENKHIRPINIVCNPLENDGNWGF
ncbi:MAG: hypothetical protein MUF15_21470, partial [Acidobacteria bacterium]|nr:hypothetical protein [Acidobacteriota bacterium]